MFEQPAAALEPPMLGVLSQGVLKTPEGRQLYHRQLRELADRALQTGWMTNRIDRVIRLLEPVEPLMTAPARALEQRILTRVEVVRKNLKVLPPDTTASK